MLLGMLAGPMPDAQVQLASTAGAVTRLIELMRRSEDGDARYLAREIFTLVTNNPDAKKCAEIELRADIAEQKENFV